jgi:hypothetical protein
MGKEACSVFMVKIVPQIDVFLPFLGIGLSATGSLALSFLSV